MKNDVSVASSARRGVKVFTLALLLFPAIATAQARTTIAGYVAADPGIAGHPLLVGVTYAREVGPLAGRVSLGLDVSTPPDAREETLAPIVSGLWSTDADALLFIGNPRGSATLVPYAVGGLGIRGYQEDGSLGVAANYSYGGGFRAPLIGAMAMEGELRYRAGFGSPEAGVEPKINNGMEYRFGLSYGLGPGAARARPVRVPAGLPTAPTSVPGRPLLMTADSRMRVAAATLSTAERYIGIPYVWGGNTPQQGFDCSGFIRYVFNLNGITVPRVSQDQARFGTEVPLQISALQPGDILAFATNGRDVDHTAIYAGNGMIIHSSSSGNGVRYDDLSSQRGQWFADHMVAARRIIE